MQHLVRVSQRSVDIAIAANYRLWSLASEAPRLSFEACRALRGRGTALPLDAQLVERLLRLPPAVGDDGYPVHQPHFEHCIGPRATHDEGIAHTGHRLHRREIGADHAATKHRRFLVGGIEHPRQHGVDAEQRPSLEHEPAVHPAREFTDDPIILGILQRDRLQVRRRKRRSSGGKRPVRQGSSARSVPHDALTRVALACRYLPRLRRRENEHLSAGGADAAHRLPVERRRHAAAGELLAVDRIQQRLLGAHLRPVRIELLRDQHGQSRLHALTDLGVLGDDGDDAVRRDADEGVELRSRAWSCRNRLVRLGDAPQVERQEQAAARGETDCQERAPRELSRGDRLTVRAAASSPVARIHGRHVTPPGVIRGQPRRLLDGGADAGVRRAAAEIAAHGLIDVVIGGSGILREQRGRRHHLTRLAVAALHHIELEPRCLHPPSDLGIADALDGHHGCIADARHRSDARSRRHAVEMHRAGAAERHATAEFRALEVELVAQHPEKRRIRFRLDDALSAIHRDRKSHVWLPVRGDAGRTVTDSTPVSYPGSRSGPAGSTARRAALRRGHAHGCAPPPQVYA